MSEPTPPPAAAAADPAASHGADNADDDKAEVVGADGKKISKAQQKKMAKMEEIAKKKAEKAKKAEEEKVLSPHCSPGTVLLSATTAPDAAPSCVLYSPQASLLVWTQPRPFNSSKTPPYRQLSGSVIRRAAPLPPQRKAEPPFALPTEGHSLSSALLCRSR